MCQRSRLVEEVARIVEVPEVVTGGMRLAEDHEEQIPVLALEQPLDDLGLLADGRQQAAAKPVEIDDRRHADLAVVFEGIGAELPP